MERKYLTVDEIEATGAKYDEQEFTIVGTRTESTLDIYSSDNTFITKMKHCLKNNPEEFQCWEAGRDSDGVVTGYFFRCPKKCLTIRSASKQVTTKMTAENKSKASERLKAYWKAKKNETN